MASSLFYPHSYQSILFLSKTPDNNSSLLKYATTHETVDRGTVHELRPRLFLFCCQIIHSGVIPLHPGLLRSCSALYLTAMINEILRDLINKGKVAAFVDDVLVGTETEEGHDEIVEEILRRLEENDLYVKLEKCVWKARKIGFLGVIMGPNGIEMEKEKMDGVLSWPEPKNVKDVRKFLGLANYYRKFIKNFAQVIRPMNVLMRKDVKWQWGQEQQKAFDKLKRIFTTRPVLAAPDLDKEFRVEADTSNYATGGVLSMKCSDELWRPVTFISKSLSDTERML